MDEQNKNNEAETKNIEQNKETGAKPLKDRRSGDRRKRPEMTKKRVVVPLVSAVVVLIFGIFVTIHSHYFQSTDDAFVEGHIISIAPRVSGPVTELLVDDNQLVKEGQVILKIDPADYEVKVQQAQAKLDEAKARLNMTEKTVEEGRSTVHQTYEDVTSAKSKLDFAQKDYKRYSDMYKDGIVSKQDYDNSSTALTVSKANHKASTERANAAKSALESNKAKAKAVSAEIERLEAELAQARLNLSYTTVYAPQSGMVASRNVEKGNYVQAAQPLLSIVPQKMWIIANFKEVQLTNMKKGQSVNIKIDTYPNKKFKGHVDSIQRATGAKSSLFPPENAVGSYVKIVQRVPVKIVFDEDYTQYNIVPGMSVVPTVRVK